MTMISFDDTLQLRVERHPSHLLNAAYHSIRQIQSGYCDEISGIAAPAGDPRPRQSGLSHPERLPHAPGVAPASIELPQIVIVAQGEEDHSEGRDGQNDHQQIGDIVSHGNCSLDGIELTSVAGTRFSRLGDPQKSGNVAVSAIGRF
jgi:hypothetical protein